MLPNSLCLADSRKNILQEKPLPRSEAKLPNLYARFWSSHSQSRVLEAAKLAA